MLEKLLKNRVRSTLFISIIILLLILLVSPLLEGANRKAQLFAREAVFDIKASQEIVIIEIDDASTQKLGRFPFDRKTYIPVIEHVTKAGAAVIAFDIIFADKSNDESDIGFADAITESGRVVFGSSYSSRGFLEQPLDIFIDHILSFGYFAPIVDSKTDMVFSFMPSAKIKYSPNHNDKKLYEHFSLVILKAYYSYIYKKDFIHHISETTENQYKLTDRVSIPLSEKHQNEILINYNDFSNFSSASFYSVYDEEQFQGVKNDINFEDKIVIIGATAKGIKDTFPTPKGIQYGVYVHANIINTILQGSTFTYFNKTLEKLLIILLIISSGYFNFSNSGKILLFVNISIAIIFLIIFPLTVTFGAHLLINYYISLLLGLILSLTFSNMLRYIIENKHKYKLNKALGEYVSKDIATEILSGQGKINLNGENKRIAICFSDIEGFTTISENFSPEDLVKFLREYLGELSHIIMDEKGFVNKYEGDAIMALWGVFSQVQGNDSLDACRAALLQQEKLGELNKDWTKRGFSEIKARIGIHTGSAIIGNIGAVGRKMEFTALGDSVNLASRLEGVNKFYGTYICVSEDTYKEVKNYFEFRYLDKIRVKGKLQSVIIYELVDFADKLTQKQKEIFEDFDLAIKFYNMQNFDDALNIFNKLEKLGDSPSRTYIERCNKYILNAPGANWDGVRIMENK